MKRSRRLLQTVCELLVAFVLVVMSVVGTGAITLPVSHVAPHQASATTSAGGGAPFSPPVSPASAPVSAWYAPHGSLGALYGPFTPGTPTMPQKRKPGEQPDLRTAASETFLNPDGTWTLKAYSVPIHYQDAQGHWQPIDNTLFSDDYYGSSAH